LHCFLIPAKPVVVNRLLQHTIQHQDFFKLCAVSSSDTNPQRDAILELLSTLFKLYPSNTCQASHIEPLIKVYHGTLSRGDRHILSIFQLFESERKISVTLLINRWSASGISESSTPLDGMLSLDPALVFRTCLHYPSWRKVESFSTPGTSHETSLYDPVFLISLVMQALEEDPPMSALRWVEFFRTNITSLLIRSLSSREAVIRESSLNALATLWNLLEVGSIHLSEVLLLLTLFPSQQTFTRSLMSFMFFL
jgi:nucleolar pre-ribosomal-associated protein 1